MFTPSKTGAVFVCVAPSMTCATTVVASETADHGRVDGDDDVRQRCVGSCLRGICSGEDTRDDDRHEVRLRLCYGLAGNASVYERGGFRRF